MLEGVSKFLLTEHINGSHLLIIGLITFIYFIIRPFINWIIKTKSVKLLSYIITSFLILITILGGTVLFNIFKLNVLQAVLRSLGVFGAGLVIYHFIKYVFQGIRGKKKRV